MHILYYLLFSSFCKTITNCMSNSGITIRNNDIALFIGRHLNDEEKVEVSKLIDIFGKQFKFYLNIYFNNAINCAHACCKLWLIYTCNYD